MVLMVPRTITFFSFSQVIVAHLSSIDRGVVFLVSFLFLRSPVAIDESCQIFASVLGEVFATSSAHAVAHGGTVLASPTFGVLGQELLEVGEGALLTPFLEAFGRAASNGGYIQAGL